MTVTVIKKVRELLFNKYQETKTEQNKGNLPETGENSVRIALVITSLMAVVLGGVILSSSKEGKHI